MQVKTAKAAILAQSREPLIVDEIALPETLGVGQVLVKVLYSTICGAQLNEIAAAKGPDKSLPPLPGHEASAQVIEIGPGVTTVKPGDTVVLHWRPSQGIQCQPPAYRWRSQKLLRWRSWRRVSATCLRSSQRERRYSCLQRRSCGRPPCSAARLGSRRSILYITSLSWF